MDKKKVEQLIACLLTEINENLERDGIKETPKRVANMFPEIFSGLLKPKFSDFKTFQSKSKGELVIVTEIPFYSICEHHLLPFFGEASIGYIPAKNQRLGLSKFVRLVNYWSKRPSIQEELTATIANELANNVPNSGVAVILTARHLCMEMRGINSRATTKTQCLLGELANNQKKRTEFFERTRK